MDGAASDAVDGRDPRVSSSTGAAAHRRVTASASHSHAVAGAAEGEPAEGRRVGPYRVLRTLGRGGMGAVYQAIDTQLKQQVALNDHLIQLGPYTLVTVDEGYAAVTQDNGKQRVLKGGAAEVPLPQDHPVARAVTSVVSAMAKARLARSSASTSPSGSAWPLTLVQGPRSAFLRCNPGSGGVGFSPPGQGARGLEKEKTSGRASSR